MRADNPSSSISVATVLRKLWVLDMTKDRQASAHLAVRYRLIHPKLPMAQEVRVSSISVSFIAPP